jgi:hypothetical protein
MIRQDTVVHEKITALFEVLNQQVVGDEHVNVLHEHEWHDAPVIRRTAVSVDVGDYAHSRLFTCLSQ